MTEDQEMAKAQQINCIEPVPRYIMPDRSAPNYGLILEYLQNSQNLPIGQSYYYIIDSDDRRLLCRIIHGGGKIFFHEVIDHEKYSISEKDFDEAMKSGAESSFLPGYYYISSEIGMKLQSAKT